MSLKVVLLAAPRGSLGALFKVVPRDAGQCRPIPAATPAAAAGVGAPLGPMPTGFPAPLLGSTTHPPAANKFGRGGRVVDPTRGPVPGAGPSGARSVCGGTSRGRGGTGRKWSDVIAVAARDERLDEGSESAASRTRREGAPVWAWTTSGDCSQQRRLRSDSATPSVTSGGSGATACCRGSSCRAASTSASPSATSTASSRGTDATRSPRRANRPRRVPSRRVASEVTR